MSPNPYDELYATDINTKDGKILHYIRSNSTVLEFGPGYGRMTQLMKEILGCKVYIVEIDKEAYESAIQYASGGICADILDFSWEKEFKGISFDTIIFANVLEYLPNPQDILERSLSLLKNDGSVFISVPNLAHSAVIIDLVNNKFDYRDIGLLDKTYKRFFTYSSLVEMLEDCSLVPVVQDGTICIPENTEFKITFNELSGNSDIIKYKKYADIYQFVFKCIKRKYYTKNKDTNQIQRLCEYIPPRPTSSCIVYLDTGAGFNQDELINVPFNKQFDRFEATLDLTPDVIRIRFDPYEGYACIIDNLNIITNSGVINYSNTNAIEINGLFIFNNTDPQIEINFNGQAFSRVRISGDIYPFDLNKIAFLTKIRYERDNLLTERNNLIIERDSLIAEKNSLLNSRSWRITRSLRKFTSFIRRNKVLYLFAKGILSLKKKGYFYKRQQLRKQSLPFLTDTLLPASERSTQKRTVFPKKIKISIITPLYNTLERFLKEMIDSVRAQTYGNWELCLADGSGKEHKNVMRICKNYARKDKRIKYKKLDRNFGISENSNKAIEMSSGDYLGLLDHDDVLHPSALYEVMKAICDKDADFIYTDEATFTNDNEISLKHHKPDYAIDTLRSCNYICHFSVFSRKLTERAGIFRSEFDGSQDYDLILRYTDIASKIVHIPKLLYFWRSHENSAASNIDNKMYAVTAGKNAIKEHLTKHGITAQVESAIESSCFYRVIYDLIERPLVSIVILNKDNVSLLQKCLSSIMEKTTYDNYEIVIVENNSTEGATFAYYGKLKKHAKIHVVYWEGKGFNYSELNNFGVQYTKGTQLLFLNNDVEIITPDWIQEMLMYSQRNDVGAVGNKLYYPNNTIQHAGVILGLNGLAGHIYRDSPRDAVGFMARLKIAQNMSVVTAACIMIKKSVFEEVGQFSSEFPASFNDVDLCLKIRRAGYLIVWTPFAEAYHYESKTRGYPDTPEKQSVFAREIALFREKWKNELAAGDPYYNCNFSLERADYSINI
jgi:GT2 family glycosyltransferase/2-polyprenyl-3-methyl-5-hydroxy-6-metoxy-1,4-benzoquinol methylase